MNSLYAQYKEEFENVKTIENETGFANYKIDKTNQGTDIVYVQEIFILPEHRGNKNAADFVDQCINQAIEENKNIKAVITSVGTAGNNVEPSMKAILNYGFKLYSASSDIIYFYKEIINE